jgi:hypothetical protein
MVPRAPPSDAFAAPAGSLAFVACDMMEAVARFSFWTRWRVGLCLVAGCDGNAQALERWSASLAPVSSEVEASAVATKATLVNVRDDACVDVPQACVRRGVQLTRTDLPRAASLFESACASGAADGCANFAVMLVDGRGVDRDRDRGRALLQRTCDDGHARSCRNLAGTARGESP